MTERRLARALVAAYRRSSGPDAETEARMLERLQASLAATPAVLERFGSPRTRPLRPRDRRPSIPGVRWTGAVLAAAGLLFAIGMGPWREFITMGDPAMPHAMQAQRNDAPAALEPAVVADTPPRAATTTVGTTPSPPRSIVVESPLVSSRASRRSGTETQRANPVVERREAPATSPVSHGSVRDEVDLLRAVEGDLRRRAFEAARAKLKDYATRFLQGVMFEEYRALEAVVACREPDGRASQIADAFLRDYPSSLFLKRVRTSCGSSDADRAVMPAVTP